MRLWPGGGLIGGALGSWVGLREALFLGATGNALAFLPLLFSPVPRLRAIRDAEAPDAEADAIVAVPTPAAPQPATPDAS